jgi:hypothetical protein
VKRVIIVLTVSVVLVFGVAAAASADGQGEGATVIKGETCTILAADWGGTENLTAETGMATVTPSGNVNLKCFFDIPAGLEPAEAVRNTGFTCATPEGPTTDSRSVATPGGKVILSCKVTAAP